jgi:hypothetical protein
MSRSKFILVLALLFLLAVPATVVAQTPEGTGTAVVFEDQGLSDGIVFTMSDVTAPGDGKEYVGWLVSDDGSKKLNTGTLAVASDGSVDHTFDNTSSMYAGENLIHIYDKAVITLEDEGFDGSEPVGPAVFFHVIPTEAMVHIRHLLTNWPPGAAQGILSNLSEQLDIAILHANLSIISDTLEDVVNHAHHVIHIIEGDDGPNFDADFANPGDGIGVLAHAADRKHATFAGGAAPDDAVINDHAALVEVNGLNAADRAIEARDAALAVIASGDLTLAKIYLGPGGATVISALQAARNGFDKNGNGTIESVVDEGGAAQAYREAQLMATYTLVPGVAPTPVPTAVPSTPVPTATPVPPPVAAQPTAPGLPGVGDSSVPVAAQLGLLAAVVLLGAGGALMIRGRRARKAL